MPKTVEYVIHSLCPLFQVANRHLTQLRDEHKTHKFVEDIRIKEEEFNRLVKQYAS